MFNLLVTWDAERGVFVPAPKYLRQLARAYEDGQKMWISRVTSRSDKQHKKFFAEFNEMARLRYLSMPNFITERFRDEDHLRKFALVSMGHIKSMTHNVFSSEEEAAKVVALCKVGNPYAVVRIEGCVVTIYVAKSMVMSGAEEVMDRKEFTRAAHDVLTFLDTLLGIALDEREQYPELEEAEFEARVRVGKAHREPASVAYGGDDERGRD